MIARIWRGAVRAEDAAAYAAYVHPTGIEGHRGTPGNPGAWLLWQTEGDRAEFTTVSLWDSREAIEAFAGQDINTAVFYPDDEQFLIERDPHREPLRGRRYRVSCGSLALAAL